MAFDGDHIFGADLFGPAVHVLRDAGLEHDLGDAFAVAEIDKDDLTVVAPAVDPSHQESALAGVGGAQLSAGVRAAEVAKKVEL